MCTEDNCDKAVHCKGLCQPHYRQAQRRERGLKKSGPSRQPDAPFSKFRERKQCSFGHVYTPDSFKVDSRGHRVCLLCRANKKKTACPAGHPYDAVNSFYVNGSSQCKTCRNQRMRERRPAKGLGAGGVNKIKTHCPKGHEYTQENTIYSSDRRRSCRTCARANSQIQNLRRYNLTVAEFAHMIIGQSGLCLICTEQLRIPVVDHDHACCPEQTSSCGKCVRGLICHNCNRGLGSFKDDIARLKSSIAYLEAFNTLA